MISKKVWANFCLLAFSGVAVARAQQIQVSRENRTIAVSATDTVKADAEIAVVQVGYHNYGRTHEQAYEDNVRTSDKILQALLGSGIAKSDINTETIQLFRTFSRNNDWTTAQKEERQFEAAQSWRIRVAAADAQSVVDLAMRSGGNQLISMDWRVKDLEALEAKASAAALGKARALAARMAATLGTKLGELLYASNRTPMQGSLEYGAAGGEAAGVIAVPPPHLKLFPKKVSQDATVYAVFAIQ
jgi:uncharacterized protein YggE